MRALAILGGAPRRDRDGAGGARPDVLAAGGFRCRARAVSGVLGGRLLTAPDVASLAPDLAARIEGDELVVLKGSRGVALERILPDLVARSSPPTP